MKLLLVTDAWAPQVNGVVRSLSRTREHMAAAGHEVRVVSPQGQRTLPCPSYPEIRLTLRPAQALRRVVAGRRFDAVHIATEGPLGIAARAWCRREGIRFTTSYHTRFPEYLRMRAPVPLAAGYSLMRWFHGPAARTLVRTETQRRLLAERGLRDLRIWPGAVDTHLFRPLGKDALDLPRPISMYMGRIAPEKNLAAFLDLDLPGSKVVVGGGPMLARYRRRYPEVYFPGYRHGEALARTLSAADVFVFPSLTDTLGLVMLEAMACGVPVAAFPVPGPADVVVDGGNGALDTDLREAVFRALAVPAEHCVDYALKHSWARSCETFVSLLVPAESGSESAGEPQALPYNSGACPSPLQVPKRASTSL